MTEENAKKEITDVRIDTDKGTITVTVKGTKIKVGAE